MLAEEVNNQGMQIFGPFPKGRNVNGKGVETMEEICAKLSLSHELREISIRRRDDAHVDGNFAVFAHPEYARLLKHPQELRLQRRVQLSNLVKEKHSSFCRANQAFPITFGPGECPASVAEEVAFSQRGADGAAVQDHQRSRTAFRIKLVNRAGDQFLAGSRLTGNQD